MVRQVLFIHSAGTQAGGQGSSAFVRQLRRSLGPGFRLTCPTMPRPDQPSYARWRRELDDRLPRRGPPWILVGHSLGGSVLLKFLSEAPRPVPVAGLFVVAAPWWGSPGWEYDEYVLRDDLSGALPDGLPIHLYQSRDDDVVAFDHLARHAQALPQAAVHALDGGGHLFAQGLPELVRDIRALPDRPA